MTDDLIARLRNEVMRNYPAAYGVTMDDAADVIAAQDAEIERLKAIVDAIPGDDKLAVAEWAVKIAAELMDEWEEGSTHADTYYIVEHWWRACPPSVRAALRGEA